MQRLKLSFCTLLLSLGWALPALGLTAEITTREPSIVGEPYTFRVTVADAIGTPQFRWNFGDDTRTEFDPATAEITHTYTAPGHYFVNVTIDDAGDLGGATVMHPVHYPLTPQRATASTSIIYDKARGRIYNVNQDSDSITAVDPIALSKVAELPVYGRPEALALSPEGKLWVVHRDDYAVAIVDPDEFVIERGFRLPYASQPVGLAISPAGDAAYITLMSLGKLLKLDPRSGSVLGELDVGPWPRGVSVSHDGKAVYVTRFISPDSGGEVVQVDGAAFSVVKRIQLAPDTTTMDRDQEARGLPNYLFSVAISPDGRDAWVAAKKDNIFRGVVRDGQELNFDSTVRPLVSILDLVQGTESVDRRIDLDDRSLPVHVEFSPLGDYGFVTLAASDMIEVRLAQTGVIQTTMTGAGITPRGSVLGPMNRLFVQGSLSRNVVVYDVSELLVSSNLTTPPKLAEISTTATEKLDPQVLRGKQIFHSTADGRMSVQGYLTCATCHFEGFEDGRVFDFTNRGEGLRNTASLLGRRGTGHGRVNWSGNFDEIQDFEKQIRELFSGHGFMPNDVLAVGTRSDPLGEPKAGLSPELDALAAYVKTLDRVNPSPFRNPDGTMTADAEAGKLLFGKLGCGFCHVGEDLTDSSRGMLHDVGTLQASSGTRAGAPLLGIDTPTLLGIWETAPYLHDGSAPTLRDVLTTKNPNDEHGFVSTLKPEQVDQLVAFLLQLDNADPPRRLPFEPPLPGAGAGAGGEAGSGGAAGLGAGGAASGAAGAAGAPPTTDGTSSCACDLARAPRGGGLAAVAALSALLAALRRRNTRGRSCARQVAA